MKRPLFLSLSAMGVALALPALAQAQTEPAAAPTPVVQPLTYSVPVLPAVSLGGAPSQLSENARGRAAGIFALIRAHQWDQAKAAIAAMDKDDALRPVVLATLYLDKDSPKVELFDLLDLINTAPWLPQADQLVGLAKKRGAQVLPTLPQIKRLSWFAGAPRRQTLATTKQDYAAQALGSQVLPLIKVNDSAGAEALVNNALGGLSNEGRTEWQHRVAWSYYINNDDSSARRMAAQAIAGGSGPWLTQAHWAAGLAAWRQGDFSAAAAAFASVSAFAQDDDMRAGGYYWAARANMAAGKPDRVEALLKNAARIDESFYGLLARETLGTKVPDRAEAGKFSNADWSSLKASPNVRAAIALVEIGENAMADAAIRYQAKLTNDRDHACLIRLARALNLPTTQIWLAHNVPSGSRPDSFARYPAPDWRPDGGWRVDKALVYAHTLQESQFRAEIRSPAGAMGLMQVMPGTARMMGLDPSMLTKPSTNMEYGQRYLEGLRDSSETGGYLPKVMAAYNAGPTPVGRWAYQVRDNGDPLLFMESIPYYETRAYVNIVMRNYWMYQMEDGARPASLTNMAQGIWPKFPGMRGPNGVRITANTVRTAEAQPEALGGD